MRFITLLEIAAIGTLTTVTFAVITVGVAQAGPNCNADSTIDSQEEELLDLINDYRSDDGLAPLVFSGTLNQAAAWKSEHMAANDYFDHGDLGIDRGFVARLRDCGYTADTWLSENIAAGHNTAAATFEQWRLSATHNATMLDSNLVAIGIGRAFDSESRFQWYWTAEFGGVADGFNPSPPRGLTGDVNCSGEVDPIDASLILQLAAGLLGSLPCPSGADINGDNQVDSIDATLLLQFKAGLIRSLGP